MATRCIALPPCPRAAIPGRRVPLCEIHQAAPPGRIGGWLSAHRRMLKMAEADVPLNASRVYDRLWVGGAPPFDRRLEQFKLLAQCAVEVTTPPGGPAFAGKVIYARLRDARPSQAELHRALECGRLVAEELQSGGRVLVTCAMGLNRSALVAGIALLTLLPKMTPGRVIDGIRAARGPNALSNADFVVLLHEVARRRR